MKVSWDFKSDIDISDYINEPSNINDGVTEPEIFNKHFLEFLTESFRVTGYKVNFYKWNGNKILTYQFIDKPIENNKGSILRGKLNNKIIIEVVSYGGNISTNINCLTVYLYQKYLSFRLKYAIDQLTNISIKDQAIKNLVKTINEVLCCEGVIVWEQKPNLYSLKTIASAGFDNKFKDLSVPVGTGILGNCKPDEKLAQHVNLKKAKHEGLLKKYDISLVSQR